MKKLLTILAAGLAAATLSIAGFAADDKKEQGADAKTGASAGTGASSDIKAEKKGRKATKPADTKVESGSGAGASSSTPAAAPSTPAPAAPASEEKPKQ
jgi:hypothetical protein